MIMGSATQKIKFIISTFFFLFGLFVFVFLLVFFGTQIGAWVDISSSIATIV